MLSIGIRFGQGFDRMSTLRVMQSFPIDYDYDFLVIGTSPGGIACAKEARLAGKKTAIIRWKDYTPQEQEGYDENMNEMAKALEIKEESYLSMENADKDVALSDLIYYKTKKKHSTTKSMPKTGLSSHSGPRGSKQDSIKHPRKVRQSRLDLNNMLFRRGKECVKVMHNAASLGDVVENAFNSGWRLCTTRPPLTINWHKMTEEIMDHVMKKDYDLVNDLSKEGIEIIEGKAVFVDNHTIKLTESVEETTITADLICIAPTGNYELPKEIDGSETFGINFDDFPRLTKPPGSTLIVGGTPEALECAGILACCRFPVTVVTQKKILDGWDNEITEMIVLNLKRKGVMFMENTTLKSVQMIANDRLLATFAPFESEEKEQEEGEEEGEEEEGEDQEQKIENFVETEDFDTILFAIRKKVNLENLQLNCTEVELEPESGKIKTNNLEGTSVPNIYAIGDAVYGKPGCTEISEVAGKLMGRRLFHNEEQEMDYSFYPIVLYTPMEYAFVGISEDAAFYRFGLYCIDVYHGFFEPLDFVLPPVKEKCFAKVIVFKSTNKIIGMHILGPKAGEIIQGFAAALRNGLTMKTLQALVGAPATSAREFLKLKELRTHEEKILTPSQIIFGVSKMDPTD